MILPESTTERNAKGKSRGECALSTLFSAVIGVAIAVGVVVSYPCVVGSS